MLNSKVVAFLGDPAFPKVAMQASRGGKIVLYQDLYSRYSRLEFSHSYDRPIAIAGLENRLIRDLKIRGGFGVLDEERRHGLLRRSLLWHRAETQQSLEKIDFSRAGGSLSTLSTPPTWSWMAYEGAIDYIHPDFDQVDWETQDIVSPWFTSPLETWSYSGDNSRTPLALSVVARKFDATDISKMLEDGDVVLDSPYASKPELECVVLGRLKNTARQEAREARVHLIMLVRRQEQLDGPQDVRVYHRAGVGSVLGNLICWDVEGKRGEIR